MATNTFATKYGSITLYKNDFIIGSAFENGGYWDEDTLLSLKGFIDPDKNILEIGGHCGTSSIVYASFLNEHSKVYVYEPQKKLYELLVKNIKDNNLEHKIIPFNKGIFCFTGKANMHDADLDGDKGADIYKRYTDESDKPCNFGGVPLGKEGEEIDVITIDDTGHDNIGFIHCDAQGSENFIFAKGIELIKKNRPSIIYEITNDFSRYLYDNVCNKYPDYEKESKFDILKFCAELQYFYCITYYQNEGNNLLLSTNRGF